MNLDPKSRRWTNVTVVWTCALAVLPGAVFARVVGGKTALRATAWSRTSKTKPGPATLLALSRVLPQGCSRALDFFEPLCFLNPALVRAQSRHALQSHFHARQLERRVGTEGNRDILKPKGANKTRLMAGGRLATRGNAMSEFL